MDGVLARRRFCGVQRTAARQKLGRMTTIERPPAAFHRWSSHSHTIIHLMGAQLYSSGALQRGFHAVLRIRACHRCNMPASGRNDLRRSTWSGGLGRTSRGRAHAGATRTDVPQFCNSRSRSTNAEIDRTALNALAIGKRHPGPAYVCTHDSTTFVLPIGHSSGRITSCTPAHRGGFNSPASQPTASVFIGSTANDAVSVRSQVEHLNVRVSNPDLPGEMRANAIRCLHTGHIGRSLIHAVIHCPQRILIYPNPIFETTNGER